MFPLGLHLDFFEKKKKNLSYIEPFNLENEKDIFNMVFGIETKVKPKSKTRSNKTSKVKAKKTQKLK
jgi:hypothetical protein